MSYFLVVPAAGSATRAMAFTGFGATPKPFVSIGGSTVFGWIMEEARRSGIEDLALIVNNEERANIYRHYFDPFADAPELKQSVAHKAPEAIDRMEQEQKMKVEYVFQKEPLGFGHAVGLAYPSIKEHNYDGIIVALGDDLIHSPSPAMQQLIEAHRQVGGMICMLERVTKEEAKRFGVAQVGAELDASALSCRKLFRIDNVVEKPSQPQPNIIDDDEYYFAIAGRYLLEEEDLKFLYDSSPSKGNELDFSSLFARNIERGRLTAIIPQGNFHTVGNALDLQKAAISFALDSYDRSDNNDDLIIHTLHELYAVGALQKNDEGFSLNPELEEKLLSAILFRQ